MNARLYPLIIFTFLSNSLHAQILEGTVTDSGSGKPIYPVSIYNITKQRATSVNERGLYLIPAQIGDSIVFSSIGYKTITQRVMQAIAISAKMNIVMTGITYNLREVVISGEKKYDYHTDSAENEVIYKTALERTPPSPFASPVSAIAEKFSRRAKRIYKFQKIYKKMEAEKFIDTRYSPAIVSSLTDIKDSSVAHFIYQYPMPYDFARSASDLEIKMWIRYNYKEWMKKQTGTRQSLNP